MDDLLFDEQTSRDLDLTDDVASRRDAFVVPPWPGGRYPEWAYFAGNSLGLMPRSAQQGLAAELDGWGALAVEAWFDGEAPWVERAGATRSSLARLVGAHEDEVVVMNTLTVNLHLLLASFYRPAGDRYRILIEETSFPSDSHAVHSQAALHGLDPGVVVRRLAPRPGEATLRTEDVVEAIEREGDHLALVLLGHVNYLTGELVDMRALTAATHAVGAASAWDLAHSIGNVPAELHDAGADFAVWCHYKYVNAGPGAPGGAFVHARHASDPTRFRLAGWWGVDPADRFRMEQDFVARTGAQGWAVSTPPILALAPLEASLEQFDDVGLTALRQRSLRLTGYLASLLDEVATRRRMSVTTPRDPAQRGCQLSVAATGAKALAERLRGEHGVVCDFREPDVLRFAPTPLYNTFHDCWRAATALAAVLQPV